MDFTLNPEKTDIGTGKKLTELKLLLMTYDGREYPPSYLEQLEQWRQNIGWYEHEHPPKHISAFWRSWLSRDEEAMKEIEEFDKPYHEWMKLHGKLYRKWH